VNKVVYSNESTIVKFKNFSLGSSEDNSNNTKNQPFSNQEQT